MSLLKKFKKMFLGGKETPAKIKVTEVSFRKKDSVKDPKKTEGVKKEVAKRPNSPKPEVKKSPKPLKEDENRERSKDRPYEKKAARPAFKSEKKTDFKNDRPRNGRRRRGGRENDETVDSVNPDFVERNFGPWSIEEFVVEPEEGKLRFHDLPIPEKIMRGIAEAGYKYATPIQALILPEAFKGADVSGKAQTGTGKTAAFLVTLFKHLLEKEPKKEKIPGRPRALVMAPTRELVIQIEKDARIIGKYTGLNIQSVFGGINYEKQRRQVEDRNIDVLVATPGRLLDFKEQGVLRLDAVEILVIDEADRMLDMGFIPDMKRIIVSAPPKGVRQTMLFSATLTPDIVRLASQWTKDPVSFEVKSKEITADAIEQRAYIVVNKEKFPLMYNMIEGEGLNRVIVFGNRRDEVSRLAEMFKLADISCGVLSGDVSQSKRIKTLEDLRAGRIRVLCATDVAARGLHVDDVSHVFNYSLPDDPEDYVHRIGRTGRAGATGVSIIFATEEDAYVIPRIEQFTGHKLAYINPEEELVTLPSELAKIMPAARSYYRTRGGAAPRSGRSGFSGGSRSGRPPRRR